jgi:hypothetical protein
MLGALPVPAYTNDLRGFITWQNAAALAFGGDRRGTHYSEAVPPEELQRARETWAAVTLSGATRRRTGFFKTASGELAKLEVIVAPIRVKENIVGVFGIAIPSSDDLPRPSASEELRLASSTCCDCSSRGRAPARSLRTCTWRRKRSGITSAVC